MMSFSDRPIARLCTFCGQFHSPTDSHLYDYHQPIDDDLTCGICLQPLVDPVDTRCGHTFCARCIKNFLKLQNTCPNDRSPLAVSDLQPAPILIRRLLDKLQVVCPNVDYCEEVLSRCDLENHLIYRCKGAVIRCHRHEHGCKYQGPRSAMESHLWECEFKDEQDFSLTTEIKEGQVTKLSILRGSCDVGMSIIGGCDTPLGAVSIQEIFPNGLVDRDDRLRPGDQLLEVNGVDLTQSTHLQAKRAFNKIAPMLKLTVYRDTTAKDKPIEKEDILKITLKKEPGRQLGIKLVGKRNMSGVYIRELIPGSVAHMDGQLKIDDRILEVNSDDLSILSQENAANHIQAAHGKLQLVVSRKSCPKPPCRHKQRRHSDTMPYRPRRDSDGSSILIDEKLCSTPCLNSSMSYKQKTVIVAKSRGESLGLSVAGGVGSQRGDTPLYVMYTEPTGPAARSGVKRGDILLSVNGAKILGLRHHDAVRILKSKAGHRKVELKLLDTTETAEGSDDFIPTWMYWLDLPSECWLDHEVKLQADFEDLGFVTAGGKNSSHGDQPLFIKAVKEGSPASKQGIRVGDVITEINGQCAKSMESDEALSLMNNISSVSSGKLSLKMISWPGTII